MLTKAEFHLLQISIGAALQLSDNREQLSELEKLSDKLDGLEDILTKGEANAHRD